MKSKIFAALVVVIILITGAGIAVYSLNQNSSDDPIQFNDSFGRKISLGAVPEKVAVVNTDIAYNMQILGLESTVVGMDADGLEKLIECSDRFGSDLIDFGKRSAFSTSTTIEKLLAAKVDTVLTPTTMGIGSTVLADVIEDKGINVVYLNAFGSNMMDTLDMMVTLFGGTDELKERADGYRNLFNSYVNEAKAICPMQDKNIDYLYYMSSSSGTLGNYYLSSSEMDSIVSSISGTNRAQSNSGSFTQYIGESLVALFYDNAVVPKVDCVFIRGTDAYSLEYVVSVFNDQGLPSAPSTVGKYMADNSSATKAVYINTHISSGMMCCFSYLVFAYAFTDGLNDTNIAYISEKTIKFMTQYGFSFVIDAAHPVCKVIDY